MKDSQPETPQPPSSSGMNLEKKLGLILGGLAFFLSLYTIISGKIKDRDDAREHLVIFMEPEYRDGQVELAAGPRKDHPCLATICFPLVIINQGKTTATILSWDCAEANQNPLETPVNPWDGIYTDPACEHKADLPMALEASKVVRLYLLMDAGLEPKVDAVIRKHYKLPAKVSRQEVYDELAKEGTSLFGDYATFEDAGDGTKRAMILERLDDQPLFRLKVQSGQLKIYETDFRFKGKP